MGEKLTYPVRPWCHTCPDFISFVNDAHKYGVTPNDIAVLAIRTCFEPPVPLPLTHDDGTPLEYWETTMPTCEPGRMKLKIDAQRYAERHGFELS